MATIQIHVQSYKSVRGDEGDCFEAVITVDGHRLAVFNDGNGGGNDYRCAHRYGRPAKQAELDAYTAGIAALEAAARAHDTAEAAKNGDTNHDPSWWSLTADVLVEDAVNRFQTSKRLTRWLKQKVVLVEGKSLFTCRLAPTPENIAKVIARNPNARILNSLPFDAALDAVLAVSA